MFTKIGRIKNRPFYAATARILIGILSCSLILGPSAAQAQSVFALNLPSPGAMIGPTPAFMPALVRGITVHPENPLKFDFLIDQGDDLIPQDVKRDEYQRLIKYFLTSLTVPEKDLWVNLSPHEKDRIVPDQFGLTEMGRDLLAQDYILKQLTASLMYPEDELGEKFWKTIYKKAREQYGQADIPVNMFNKVWIVPDSAVVFEQGNTAYVADARLKVMLEADYEAERQLSAVSPQSSEGKLTTDDRKLKADIRTLSEQIIHEIIIPEIEKEVNTGKNFTQLRQIYNSLILAAWYKQNLKQSLLSQVYVDKNKISGVDTKDKDVKQKIYDQYMQAFKQGVYNYIKEDVDSVTQETVPRKYFSGGAGLQVADVIQATSSPIVLSPIAQSNLSNLLQRLPSVGIGSSPIETVAVNLLEFRDDERDKAEVFAWKGQELSITSSPVDGSDVWPGLPENQFVPLQLNLAGYASVDFSTQRPWEDLVRQRRLAGVTPERIHKARELLKEFGIITKPTPLMQKDGINLFVKTLFGIDREIRVWFKDETVNPTGSFKDRAPFAFYEEIKKEVERIQNHPEDTDSVFVILLKSVSTGNHGKATVGAVNAAKQYVGARGLAHRFDLTAEVTLGTNVLPHKVKAIKDAGGIVRQYYDVERAKPILHYLAAENLVLEELNSESPKHKKIFRQIRHSDENVVSSYSVVALEIIEQLEEGGVHLDELERGELAISVPLGSGGFLSGLNESRAHYSRIDNFGSTAPETSMTFRSFAENGLIREPDTNSKEVLTDGNRATPEPFSLNRIPEFTQAVMLVTEDDAMYAAALLFMNGIVVEPTSALALAEAFIDEEHFDKDVLRDLVIPLSSKNISDAMRDESARIAGLGEDAIMQYFKDRREQIRKAKAAPGIYKKEILARVLEAPRWLRQSIKGAELYRKDRVLTFGNTFVFQKEITPDDVRAVVELAKNITREVTGNMANETQEGKILLPFMVSALLGDPGQETSFGHQMPLAIYMHQSVKFTDEDWMAHLTDGPVFSVGIIESSYQHPKKENQQAQVTLRTLVVSAKGHILLDGKAIMLVQPTPGQYAKLPSKPEIEREKRSDPQGIKKRIQSAEMTITAELIDAMTTISGDENPVHQGNDNGDPNQYGIFKKRIAHGFLGAALIHLFARSQGLFEDESVASLSYKFNLPVFVGDRVRVILEEIENPGKKGIRNVQLVLEKKKHSDDPESDLWDPVIKGTMELKGSIRSSGQETADLSPATGPKPIEGRIILVVDDIKSVLFIAERNLEGNGFEVLTANDGLPALEIMKQLEKEGRKVDLLITDLNMLRMDGDELVAEVKRLYPGVAIAMQTGVEEKDRAKLSEKLKISVYKKSDFEAIFQEFMQDRKDAGGGSSSPIVSREEWTQGLEALKQVATKLPGLIAEKVIDNKHMLQVFSGLTAEVGSHQKNFILTLFSQEQREQLIEAIESQNGFKVLVHDNGKYSIINLKAVRRIIGAHRDVFPTEALLDGGQWILDNVEQWRIDIDGQLPVTFNSNDAIVHLRHGLLSGYPRSAAKNFYEFWITLNKVNKELAGLEGEQVLRIQHMVQAELSEETKRELKKYYREVFGPNMQIYKLSDKEIDLLIDAFKMNGPIEFFAFNDEDKQGNQRIKKIWEEINAWIGLNVESDGRSAMRLMGNVAVSSPVSVTQGNDDGRLFPFSRDPSHEPKVTSNKVGGIDLNPSRLNLQIKRDGNGVPLPINLQPIGTMQIDGFVPVIINITPVISLPLLSAVIHGNTPTQKADQQDEYQPSPMAYLYERRLQLN